MKQLLAGIFFIFMATHIQAQSFDSGDVMLTGGIGAGHYGYHTGPGYSGFGLPLVLNVDIGIHDYVSLGPYFGVLFKDESSAIGFGGRGSFHFWQLIDQHVNGDLRGDIFDIYGSAYAGGEVSGYYSDRFRAGGILGARWFFSPNIALTVEFGGPMSYFMAGMTFKLID